MDEFLKIDIYELFNISVTAEEKDIKSAYRKKALKCHPDKNPNDPKAAELFQQLSKALAILTDSNARAAYDQVLRAKKAAIVRNRELDTKRKKLKEDLEAREKAARDRKHSEVDAATNLQREIDRLRREGYKLIEQEKEILRQQISEERKRAEADGVVHEAELPRLKIKWTISKGMEDKNGYVEDELKAILEKHGHITGLVVSSTKRGTAIVEFSDVRAAESAVKSETGRPDNPLKLSWICGKPKVNNNDGNIQNTSADKNTPVPDDFSTITFRDYESIVMMKLRQAEERKKLIQQIQDEDGES